MLSSAVLATHLISDESGAREFRSRWPAYVAHISTTQGVDRMRILVAACAWPTHFLPMAPLCWALTAAGHDVRAVVPPALVPTVTGAGAVAVPAGRDVDFMAVVRAAMAPAAGDERLDPRALRVARGARSMGMFATVADA